MATDFWWRAHRWQYLDDLADEYRRVRRVALRIDFGGVPGEASCDPVTDDDKSDDEDISRDEVDCVVPSSSLSVIGTLEKIVSIEDGCW